MTIDIVVVSLVALPSSFTIFNFGAQKVIENNVKIRFAQRENVVPLIPIETNYHPSIVYLLFIE
jgi:hypothetical protein